MQLAQGDPLVLSFLMGKTIDRKEKKNTSHVGIHAPSTRTMRMPMSPMGVSMSTMAVPVTSMAVISVAMPMRVPVVMARAAALGRAVGVGVTEGTDAHQVDKEAAN